MENLKPKVIFFAPILEYPPAGGPQMSVTNAVKALSEVSQLHIITTVPESRLGPEAQAFFKSKSHALVFAPSSTFNSNHPLGDRILRKVRRLISPLLALADVRFTVEYARKYQIEIFWVDRVLEYTFYVFQQLRRKEPRAYVIGDTCSVYSRFVLRELPLIKNPIRRWWVEQRGRKKIQEEKELTEFANVVTAVSELDAEYFRSIAPRPQTIKLFSNVVDLLDYKTHVPAPASLQKPYVLLMGVFGHKNSPMDRAAKWLVEEIMPLVLSEVPDARLYIVGKNSDRTLAHYQSPSVVVTGRVPSMLPYLQGASATLVPLMYESGTRFKILESGAAAIPCISTTLGAEGIRVTDKENIIIADNTVDFARAIVDIFKNPEAAKSLGQNLHTLVKDQYSIETQKRDADTVLQFLHGTGKSARDPGAEMNSP
ncbi:MAG: hypothetical protein COT73_00360 [Bdellovibrio sp. CG10_big_fil_rev_8_21_14_0_10_47_8]|nr:MAG: hypothetical protein COT73_00360 [Bdellovibrio sp. CG10_big_fil_rev_8_21_14_0_10_47_8]